MTDTAPAPLSGAPETATPADVVYDDMTAAWRDGDYPLAAALAAALLTCVSSTGNQLTGFRDLYYARLLAWYYARSHR